MAPKLRGSAPEKSTESMHDMADRMYGTQPEAPPPTTPYTASPSMQNARAIQRKIINEGKTPKPVPDARGPSIPIGNPFTAASDLVKRWNK